MKTGVIVYVTGNESPAADTEAAVKNLNIDADRLEIVSDKSGHFDIADAWWTLTVKGMQRIFCMIAEYSTPKELKLTGRSLRLCG